MTKEEVIEKVKTLSLPEDSYVVFGSGPMAAIGLRDVNDIDLYVSPDVHQKLRIEGWKELVKGPSDKPLTHDVFEAHDNWSFSAYNPSLNDLLKNAFKVDGVNFASIEDVKKWKESLSRPKDIVDLELINNYLSA